MISVIKPPTPEILALCDAIDHLIEVYLGALASGKTRLGRFEAELEAYILHKLILRHAEALVLMARHDLVLLPSAHVTARAAFEAHLKIVWMLKPVDPFEQEGRWVVHLNSAVEHWTKLSKGESLDAEFRDAMLARGEQHKSFAASVGELLVQQGYTVPAKSASVWDMLKELDQKHLYALYIQFSAYTHSNFEAAALYRKNLGCGKELGEFIHPQDWALPIEAVWKSLFIVSQRVLQLVECPADVFPSATLCANFDRLIQNLRVSKRDEAQ